MEVYIACVFIIITSIIYYIFYERKKGASPENKKDFKKDNIKLDALKEKVKNESNTKSSRNEISTAITTLNKADSHMLSYSYSTDLSFLTSNSDDITSISPRFISQLKGHTGAITSFSISDNNVFLATASTDGTIRIWKNYLSKNAQYVTIKLLHDFPSSVSFAGTSYLIVGLEESAKILFYSLNTVINNQMSHFSSTFKVESISLAHEFSSQLSSPIKLCQLSTTLKFLITVARGEDTHVNIFTPKGEKIYSFKTNQMYNYNSCYSTSGALFAVAAKFGDTKIYSVDYDSNGGFKGLVSMGTLPNKISTFSLCFSSGGGYAITGNSNGSFSVWDLSVRWKDGQDIKHIKTVHTPLQIIELIVAHPENSLNTIAVAGENKILIYQFVTGVLLENISNAHRGRLSNMQFTSNGKHLITSSTDKLIKVWNVDNIL